MAPRQCKDVRLGGGVATICQYLTAGLIDEIHLSQALRRLHAQRGNGCSRFDRLFEAKNFGKELTPELRAQEQRLRAEIERQRKSRRNAGTCEFPRPPRRRRRRLLTTLAHSRRA